MLKAIKQSGSVSFEYATKESKNICKRCYWWHPSGTNWSKMFRTFSIEFYIKKELLDVEVDIQVAQIDFNLNIIWIKI
jgi:hypothetical protein